MMCSLLQVKIFLCAHPIFICVLSLHSSIPFYLRCFVVEIKVSKNAVGFFEILNKMLFQHSSKSMRY